MKRLKRFVLSAVFTAMLMLPATAFAEEATITIFHTNDVHGRFIESSSAIGIDTVAAIRKTTDNA